MQGTECDVLIIGGGLAGVFAAIKAKEAGAEKVTLVSKGKLGKDSISTFAAGVFRAHLPEDDLDAAFKHYAISDSCGAGIYDEEWLNIFLESNYQTILDMDRWGVKWEKTPDGKIERKQMRWKQLQAMFHGPQMM